MGAHHLPVVTVSNMRSLFPKDWNHTTDMLERQVDVSLCCEIWEKAENRKHKDNIEQMLELHGLKYFSTPRPRGKRGGGAAIILKWKNLKSRFPITWKLFGRWLNPNMKRLNSKI